MPITTQYEDHMRSALHMAKRGEGRTAENPSVGCVIVKNGQVLARARTSDNGRPHAETNALGMISAKEAIGASLYVTLEPCSHIGKTPPCTDSIINAGIANVYIGMRDPDYRVAGQGITKLHEAGITVISDVLSPDVEDFYTPYTLNRTEERPFVALKIASTLDTKIAAADGTSQWITGKQARDYGHALRARYQAIAVGAGTVRADNPALTVRGRFTNHNGSYLNPLRVIFDTNLNLSHDYQVFQIGAKTSSCVFCSETIEEKRYKKHLSTGVNIYKIDCQDNGLLNISTALKKLHDNQIQSILIEGGSLLITSFLKAGLYDRVYWFKNPSIIGETGRNAIGDIGVNTLVDKTKLIPIAHRQMGEDTVSVYDRKIEGE